MITIDKDRVLELLDQAVADRGADYIDPAAGNTSGCKYVVNDQPGCIAGLVFSIAGVPISTLTVMDVQGSLKRLTPERLREYGIEIAPDAHDLLNFAQGEQDAGKSWGAAVSGAKTLLVKEA